MRLFDFIEDFCHFARQPNVGSESNLTFLFVPSPASSGLWTIFGSPHACLAFEAFVGLTASSRIVPSELGSRGCCACWMNAAISACTSAPIS